LCASREQASFSCSHHVPAPHGSLPCLTPTITCPFQTHATALTNVQPMNIPRLDCMYEKVFLELH
jgi:hypothetical protein